MAIYAPFTPEQVTNLNEYQSSGLMHPFTCADRDDHNGVDILIATESGWHCPFCDYTQSWAHEGMADGSWVKQLRAAGIVKVRKP